MGSVVQHARRLKRHVGHLFDPRLNRFASDTYSENGEDGVIRELFHRMRVQGGWIVEFGAWDGMLGSNTFRLIEESEQFRAVYIEGDASRYQDLVKTANRVNGRIIPINAYVQSTGAGSLSAILSSTPIPLEFELLSIDVDSTDYFIWKELEGYKPKLVIIEINSSIPSGVEYFHGQGEKSGSSFLSTLKLGLEKGYTLVCHTGNMFFVRNDLVPRIHLQGFYLEHPERLFTANWLPRNRVGDFDGSR